MKKGFSDIDWRKTAEGVAWAAGGYVFRAYAGGIFAVAFALRVGDLFDMRWAVGAGDTLRRLEALDPEIVSVFHHIGIWSALLSVFFCLPLMIALGKLDPERHVRRKP